MLSIHAKRRAGGDAKNSSALIHFTLDSRTASEICMVSYNLGIDVGGTFTDLVCADESGHIETEKVLSTAENQALGVLSGIEKLASKYGVCSADLLGQISVIVHGTTVATNTMLEYNGANTGLITTAGFRDIIEIRRNYKEAAFDIRLPAPYPIVPRRHHRRYRITEGTEEIQIRRIAQIMFSFGRRARTED